MTYDKSGLEELSRKYFGQNHADLSPQEKLAKLLENLPLDSVAYQAAVEGARKLDFTQTDEVLYNLMTAFEELPKALDSLETALSELENKASKNNE